MALKKTKDQTSTEVEVHVSSSGVQHVDSKSFSENPKIQRTIRKFLPSDSSANKKET